MRTNNKHIQMRLQVQKRKNKSQNPELDKVTIEQAINNINSAINNLNGEAKLTKAKEDAVASINNLSGLTNEQKQKKIKPLMALKLETKLLIIT